MSYVYYSLKTDGIPVICISEYIDDFTITFACFCQQKLNEGT